MCGSAVHGVPSRATTRRSRSRSHFRVPVSYKYGAEAIALIGIAYGLIKWVGRSLRSQVSDRSHETARLATLAAQMPASTIDALVRQGLVSAEELERMTPREREFLVATAGQRLGADARGTSRRLTPITGDAVRSTTRPTRIDTTQPTRLHLITPSRPPLGLAVHCPGCGTPLDRDALQRVGTASCQRCKRPVSAHIQRGRLTVIVEESVEEAAHRQRIDGGP